MLLGIFVKICFCLQSVNLIKEEDTVVWYILGAPSTIVAHYFISNFFLDCRLIIKMKSPRWSPSISVPLVDQTAWTSVCVLIPTSEPWFCHEVKKKFC